MEDRDKRRTEREARRATAAQPGRSEAVLARYLLAEAYDEERREREAAETTKPSVEPPAEPAAGEGGPAG